MVLAALSVWTAPALAETRSLSEDWLFQKGDIRSAENPPFDDTTWRKVSVPHDFSIMDKPDGSAPFDPQAISGQDSGYLPGGIGWYRRHLNLTSAEAAKVVRLNFEAIYMDADVWLNGEHLTRHHYGYTAFSVDLTGRAHAGDNVVAVRADHADPSSRWYAGSGIIRPATLEILDCVNVDPDTVAVTTPVATEARGVVSAKSSVINRSPKAVTIELVSQVVSPLGATVAEARQARSIAAGGRTDSVQTLELAHPLLMVPGIHRISIRSVQEVRVGGMTRDERRMRFGMRTVTFDFAQWPADQRQTGGDARRRHPPRQLYDRSGRRAGRGQAQGRADEGGWLQCHPQCA